MRRTVAEVLPSLSAGHGGSEKLLAAVAQVQTGAEQREILHILLDQTAGFCARSALFVVKPESVAGWQAIGFSDDDAVRDFALDASLPLLRKVLTDCAPAVGDSTQMDTNFLDSFNAPVNGECHLLPLFLKEKVAAVLYADAGGAEASCERAALDLLVRFTSLWLEVQAARESAHAAVVHTATDHTAVHATPESATPVAEAANAHAPTPVAAPVQEVHQEAAPMHAPAGFAAAATAAAPAIEKIEKIEKRESAAPAEMSAADADTHKKAQRFARLLIDEIKLYNKGKVEEGCKQRDLYDRLRDDIDKSRATYAKRYGSTVAAAGDYFIRELLRGLAQGDASLLGPNFKR